MQLYRQCHALLKMDSHVIKLTEAKCRNMSFDDATIEIKHLREKLLAYPSPILQARLEFDVIIRFNLAEMCPLELMRISQLKMRLMQILKTQQDELPILQ